MYEQKGKNYDDDYTTLRNLVYKIIKRGRYSETERKKKKKILQQMNTIGIIFWCGINYRVAIVRSSAEYCVRADTCRYNILLDEYRA